jgi:hypothetical protein
MTTRFDPTSLPPRWRERDGRHVLDAWRRSGLSVRAFARKHQLRERRLYRWCRRLGVALRTPSPTTPTAALPAFVEVTTRRPDAPVAVGPAAPAPPVREPREPYVVQLRDATVRVPADFDPDRLADLVAVLRC